MTKSGVTETGVEELDGIFGDGIPRANTILVQGQAGTGKTLMGLERSQPGPDAFRRGQGKRRPCGEGGEVTGKAG